MELDLLLHRADFEVVPFAADQLRLARDAYERYGKGRHPAGLNLGDCCAYALARHTGEPLLFKGGRFPAHRCRAGPLRALGNMTRGYKTQCNAIAAGDLTALEAAIVRHPDGPQPLEAPRRRGPTPVAADMVRALIAAGADPNVISGTGARHTPLTRLTEHHATIPRHDGHREALVALLEGGANPNLRAGPHHFEPLAYAAVAPAQDFIDLLRRGGARISVHLARHAAR